MTPRPRSHRTRTFDLAPRTLLPLRGHDGATVRVLRGRIWVTGEGDPRDLVLAAGQAYPIEGRGTVLVEGLSLARVAIERPRPVVAVIAEQWWMRGVDWAAARRRRAARGIMSGAI